MCLLIFSLNTSSVSCMSLVIILFYLLRLSYFSWILHTLEFFLLKAKYFVLGIRDCAKKSIGVKIYFSLFRSWAEFNIYCTVRAKGFSSSNVLCLSLLVFSKSSSSKRVRILQFFHVEPTVVILEPCLSGGFMWKKKCFL